MHYKEIKAIIQIIKQKSTYPAWFIFEEVYVCKQTYIPKMRRNDELRWEEYENISKDCEPAKHLKGNLSHKFSWQILFAASENKQIRKIVEAS